KFGERIFMNRASTIKSISYSSRILSARPSAAARFSQGIAGNAGHHAGFVLTDDRDCGELFHDLSLSASEERDGAREFSFRPAGHGLPNRVRSNPLTLRATFSSFLCITV